MHTRCKNYPNLFYSQSNGEVSLVPRADVLIGAYFILAVIAPTLLSLKLVSRDSMMTYNP